MAPALSQPKHRPWIEITLGVVTLCAALIVWQALGLHERRYIQKTVAAATSSIQADLLADIQVRLRDQAFFAQHAQLQTSTADWTAHAEGYLEQNPWCSLVLWLDPQEQVKWVVPQSRNQEALRQAVLSQTRQMLPQALQTRQVRMTHSFQLPSGETVAVTVVPAFRAEGHVGFLVTVADLRKLIDSMLEDTSQMGFNMAVYDDSTEIGRVGEPTLKEQQWAQSAEVQIPGAAWRVRVWPRPEQLAQMQSVVPEIMVGVVSLLGLALIVAAHFERNARDKSLRLTGEMAERQRIEAVLRGSQDRLAGVLDTSADAIISTDEDLRITLFNQGAQQIFGYTPEEAVGLPLDVLLPPRFRAAHRQHMARFAAGAQSTMRMSERTGVAGLRKDGAEFPAEAAISKLRVNGETVLTAILRDVSSRVAAQQALSKAHHELEERVAERTKELAAANATLRQLSGHLLQSQEEERRRIARELHDHTAGNLVFINMMLDKISSGRSGEDVPKDLSECQRWVQQTMEDIRTLSYRMHPPMLEGLGLLAALRWYVAGFSQRSGIAIFMKFDPSTPRLYEDAELALFRVVQESLTNIHRHSQSHKAEISLGSVDGHVRLEITDYGVGIRPELLRDTAQFGVGIAGMAERIRQLGGELNVQSNARGTTISATLPLEEKNSAVAASEPS